MTTRKSNGSATAAEFTPAKNAVGRVAAWIGRMRERRSLPALRIPSHPKVHAIQASWVSAFWSARLAVRCGVPLETFLQHRLSQHLARTASPARLGVTLSVDASGAIASAPTASPHRVPWIESFLRAAGPATLNPEILLAQGDAARLATRIESQRARVGELTCEVEQRMRGVELVDPGDAMEAQQMGRPAVPRPIGTVLQLFALALLVAESWQLAVPSLELAGIQTAQLASELQRDAVAVIMGCVFALGASATLFLLAHLALRRVLDPGDQHTRQARLWTGVTSAVAVALIVGLAWSIASLPHAPGEALDMSYARSTMFLVLIAIPFTGAWLLGLARRADQERDRARSLARAWDQEHYRSLSDVSRRVAALREEEQQLEALEAERAAVIHRLRVLQQRCATAQRLAADALEEEEQAISRAIQGITTALDRDRYEYLRQACARGIRVARPEPAAPLLTAPVTPAAVRPAREVPEHNLGLAG